MANIELEYRALVTEEKYHKLMAFLAENGKHRAKGGQAA
jgi:hypothetical protein